MDVLQALSASVVCLQEVEGELYDQFLKPEMCKLGYEGSFLRLSKKDAAVKIGVATFFHSCTFRLLKVGPFCGRGPVVLHITCFV